MKYICLALAFILPFCALVAGITYYSVNIDPKVSAMSECTAGFPSTERQIECARIIFGSSVSNLKDSEILEMCSRISNHSK